MEKKAVALLIFVAFIIGMLFPKAFFPAAVAAPAYPSEGYVGGGYVAKAMTFSTPKTFRTMDCVVVVAQRSVHKNPVAISCVDGSK